jgi:lipopolysaccharide transport system permease protein
VRDIKLRYTQTFLGVAWVVLQPLVMGGLFSLIFGKWLHLESEGVPYLLFAFCGLVPWTFVYQGIQRAVNGIQGDKAIINKIYFPRLLIPLSVAVVSLIDVAILVVILVFLIKIMGGNFSWHIGVFPLCMVPGFFLALGFGAFFSSLAIYYRDVMNLLPFFLQIFMYLSPVLYSSQMVQEKWHLFYELNPMVGLIDACRWCFLNTPHFPLESFLISGGISLGIGVLGVSVFMQLERYFADWI